MLHLKCKYQHRHYQQHHQQYPREEVEEFFHEMDRDFDGRLSFEVTDFYVSMDARF